jgi:hypothetical protein
MTEVYHVTHWQWNLVRDPVAWGDEALDASCEQSLLLPLAPSLFRPLPPLTQWIHLVPYHPPPPSIVNSVSNWTGSLERGVCFLRLPQHPVPGWTEMSSRVTTPSRCPVPLDMPTRLLNRVQSIKFPFTLSHDNIGVHRWKKRYRDVTTAVFMCGDKQNNKQEMRKQTIKIQYVRSLTRFISL